MGKSRGVSQFRVMSWNVENLFDVGDEDGPDTQAELKAKVESLRSLIDQQNPHVLGLQEIGSEAALGRLQAALKAPMPYRAVAAPDERGIRVAFLSRRVLHDPLQIRPFPRGLLPVQVGDDPPGPDGPRTMNLMGRAALLASQGQTRPVILMGDMNDEPHAATTLILNGPPGSEIGSVGFDQPDQGDGDRMWNTAPLIPEPKRFSRLYRGLLELIDHIFVSHFLVTGTRITEVTTVTAEAGIPSIDDNPNERIGEPGSDHAAIIATFDF